MKLSASLVLTLSAALAAVADPCLADQIVKSDGSRLNCRIVSETGGKITYELHSGGVVVRQSIARSKVRSVIRDTPEGPGYCPLPVVGGIGDDVTADGLRQGFSRARAAKARCVVLVIDSPGGSVEEMDKILDVLRDYRDIARIAYVRQAGSAAAVIAMACPRLYMAPRGTIGAAVPYRVGPDGTPQLVEEKFQSMIRARMRVASQLGGRSELWIRGMTEGDLELAVVHRNGKPELLVSGGRLPHADDAASPPKVVKPRGQILTLTAAEAKEYGLSLATCDSVDRLKEPLGLKAWHVADDRAWHVVLNIAKAARWHAELDEQRRREQADRTARAREARAELSLVDALITKAEARVAAVQEALTKLHVARDRSIADSESILDEELQVAFRSDDVGFWVARARESASRRRAAIEEQYHRDRIAFEASRDEAAAEGELLSAKKRRLLSTIASAE